MANLNSHAKDALRKFKTEASQELSKCEAKQNQNKAEAKQNKSEAKQNQNKAEAKQNQNNCAQNNKRVKEDNMKRAN